MAQWKPGALMWKRWVPTAEVLEVLGVVGNVDEDREVW